MLGELTALKVLLAAVSVVVVSLIALAIYLGLKVWPIGGEVPILKTPTWEIKNPNEYRDELMLRRETKAGGALLIKRGARETVYRYDPQEQSLNAVSDAEWQNADGPVAKCFDFSTPKAPRDVTVTRNEPKHQLLIGKWGALREVPTAGGFPLAHEVSPSGKWVAVLSGTGPAIPALLPFGGQFVLGQRYHEILSLPDARHVSKPIRFPVRDTKDFFQMCWSADEEFVVHTYWRYTYLVVVPTGVSQR